MTAIATDTPPCPVCGSEMYDNRADVAKRVAAGQKAGPIFKCKQYKSGCQGVIWPPRGAARQAAPAAPAKPLPAVVADQAAHEDMVLTELNRGEVWSELKTRYIECLAFTTTVVARKLTETDIGTDPASILAATHALFIERNKRNV